ncbi:MAG: S8 family serine peptidase [Bacteroidota bacterium]
MIGFFRVISPCIIILLCFCSSQLVAQNRERVAGELIIWADSPERWEALEKVAIGYTPSGLPVFPRVSRFLSPHIPIAVIQYQEEWVEEDRALKVLSVQEGVYLAQFNHYVNKRESQQVFPNDSEFLGQWALNNNGQTGGTEDADIDAPEAWERTTGGNAATGDRIVVAVVDDGFHVDHPDIQYWQNVDEIPDNGIDDDENGYIDDAICWNAYQQNGVMEEDNHGTQVAGIIGAIGNNGIGVAGVNWDVDIMPILGASIIESVVVESYLYILNERRIYNQSGGKKGSFVAVLNSSFGVDKGRPEEFPIWCELYNELGQEGILCPVAVANSGIDVAVEGDIPTLCPSEFLISVSSSNQFDERNSAAFNSEFVDLVAPGSSILTTSGNDSYRRISGTSFATPFVSGLASLLVAGACPSWMVMYKNHPEVGVQMLKDWIMQGVDTLDAFQGFTLSGGRINADKSLFLVEDFCATVSACTPPFDATVSQLTDVSAVVNWKSLPSSDRYLLKLTSRKTQEETLLPVQASMITLSGLEGCSEYFFSLTGICGSDTSEFGPDISFTTEGCCSPPENIQLLNRGEDILSFSWGAEFDALSYSIRYKVKGDSVTPWQVFTTSETVADLTPLDPCTDYEIQLATLCDTGLSVYSPILEAQTKGCSFCEDQPYCEFNGQNSTQDWIGRVSIDTFTNMSDNDDGYGNYTNLTSVPLESGKRYPFILQPEFSGVRFDERWYIWLDVNQDGFFKGENELLYQNTTPISSAIQDTIQIPDQVVPGITRLRVVMRFDESNATCGSFRFGEVEDYCVDLQLTTSNQPGLGATDFEIYPNPAYDRLAISSPSPLANASLRDIQGKELMIKTFSGENEVEVDISSLPTGYYILSVATSKGIGVKRIAKL